jgi:hypothetical protein
LQDRNRGAIVIRQKQVEDTGTNMLLLIGLVFGMFAVGGLALLLWQYSSP